MNSGTLPKSQSIEQ